MGNFIEAIEGGADYVAMISSPGICRLGEYGAGIQNTLEDMGYHANYIELQLYDGIKGMFRFLTQLSGVKKIPLQLSELLFLPSERFLLCRQDGNNAFFLQSKRNKTGDAEKAFKKRNEAYL